MLTEDTGHSDEWGTFATRAGEPGLAWVTAPSHQWASVEIRRMAEHEEDNTRSVECVEYAVPDAWSVYACDEFSGASCWVSDYRNPREAEDAVRRLKAQLLVVRRLQGMSIDNLLPEDDF